MNTERTSKNIFTYSFHECLNICKTQYNNSTLSGDIDDLLFPNMPDHNQQNLYHQTVASMNV